MACCGMPLLPGVIDTMRSMELSHSMMVDDSFQPAESS